MIEILVVVVLVVGAAWLVWQAITALWVGAVLALAVVAWAKHAYPAIPVISYFQRRQRRWRLPAPHPESVMRSTIMADDTEWPLRMVASPCSSVPASTHVLAALRGEAR